MNVNRILAFLFFGALFFPSPLVGQRADSGKGVNRIVKKAYREGLKLITTIPSDTTVNIRNAEAFLPFQNKIIRDIYIQQIGFEKSIYDSMHRTEAFVNRMANGLHRRTREATVRKHLFFHKNKPLNPFLLADNERYLRDRDFILDCRMVVTPTSEGSDSVDITVITRDVFSLGFNVGGSIPTAPQFGVYDNNFLGRGQRLIFTGLYDPGRNPTFGWSSFFRKSSLLGTLVDLELGYSELKTGTIIGLESEYSYSIRLNRPLVSPYSRLAGGIDLSKNWSRNLFSKPDSIFQNYRYNMADYWIGYNFGVGQKLENQFRYFFAVRYFDGDILNQFRELELGGQFQSTRLLAYLGEFTIYRQEFYKTRYIFGFGRTEDVPVGLSLSFTAGYTTQLAQSRSYLGAKLKYSWVNLIGNIFRFELQTGSYSTNYNSLEDAVVNARATYYTRAVSMGKNKLRTMLSLGYVGLFNRTLSGSIGIKLTDLQGLVPTILDGRTKFQGRIESTLYTRLKPIGFRIAPFVGADLVSIGCGNCTRGTQTGYAISSGVRFRNENLIFGTVEVRFTFFPNSDFGQGNWGSQFNENLKIRNSDLLVRAPALVPY